MPLTSSAQSTSGHWTITNGSVSTSGSIGGVTSANIYGNTYTPTPTIPSSSQLPAIVIDGHDDAGNKVSMTLQPEANISSGDVMKIMMLSVTAIMVGTGSFNPLNYVKTHNLERHFKYA